MSAEPIVTLDWLIRVGRGPDGDELRRVSSPGLPSVPRQLQTYHARKVHLHENHRRAVVSAAEFELCLIPSGETVVTAVGATAIGVERPLKWHAVHPIESAPALNLLVGRVARSAHRAWESAESLLFDTVGDVQRRR